MSDVQVERTIAASPDVVWELLTDVTRMGEWSPETVRASWVGSEHRPVPGARFKGHNQNGPKKWTTACTVVEAEPGRSFVFDVKAGPFAISRWEYRFEPAGAGCLVTEMWTDRRPGFMKPMGQMFSGVRDRDAHNRTTMAATLERLATAAERASTS